MAIAVTQEITWIVRIVRNAMGDTETSYVGPFVTSVEADNFASWKELEDRHAEVYVELLITQNRNGYHGS